MLYKLSCLSSPWCLGRYTSQVGLELTNLLFRPPESYRCVSKHLEIGWFQGPVSLEDGHRADGHMRECFWPLSQLLRKHRKCYRSCQSLAHSLSHTVSVLSGTGPILWVVFWQHGQVQSRWKGCQAFPGHVLEDFPLDPGLSTQGFGLWRFGKYLTTGISKSNALHLPVPLVPTTPWCSHQVTLHGGRSRWSDSGWLWNPLSVQGPAPDCCGVAMSSFPSEQGSQAELFLTWMMRKTLETDGKSHGLWSPALLSSWLLILLLPQGNQNQGNCSFWMLLIMPTAAVATAMIWAWRVSEMWERWCQNPDMGQLARLLWSDGKEKWLQSPARTKQRMGAELSKEHCPQTSS